MQFKGFVPVGQENGMPIAFATAEGELAADVDAGAGPYAKALNDEIAAAETPMSWIGRLAFATTKAPRRAS